MSNNLGKMHDAFLKHNNALGPTGSGGIKSELHEGTMMPGKPQTPAQHQAVTKAAQASAATRSNPSLAKNVQSALRKSGLPDTSNVTISPPKKISEGIAKPKAKPGFAPNPFGEKKDY